MVTWGPNSVREYQTPAATTGGGFSFAKPPAAPSPTPVGTGVTTNMFGGLVPAPATPAPSSFLGTPAPTPAAPGFGSPGFGTSGFGAPGFGAQAAPAAPGMGYTPSQAAVQAHWQASARLEMSRMEKSLTDLYDGYTAGTKFQYIFYNEMTPQQRMELDLTTVPPRPYHVDENKWAEAVASNPNRTVYIPVCVVGADGLATRLAQQQQRAEKLEKHLQELSAVHQNTLQPEIESSRHVLYKLQRKQVALSQRLLKEMRKLELTRCRNLPVQPAEVAAHEKLLNCLRQVNHVSHILGQIRPPSSHGMWNQQQAVPPLDAVTEQAIFKALKQQQEGLAALAEVVRSDTRTFKILKQELEAKTST